MNGSTDQRRDTSAALTGEPEAPLRFELDPEGTPVRTGSKVLLVYGAGDCDVVEVLSMDHAQVVVRTESGKVISTVHEDIGLGVDDDLTFVLDDGCDTFAHVDQREARRLQVEELERLELEAIRLNGLNRVSVTDVEGRQSSVDTDLAFELAQTRETTCVQCWKPIYANEPQLIKVVSDGILRGHAVHGTTLTRHGFVIEGPKETATVLAPTIVDTSDTITVWESPSGGTSEEETSFTIEHAAGQEPSTREVEALITPRITDRLGYVGTDLRVRVAERNVRVYGLDAGRVATRFAARVQKEW